MWVYISIASVTVITLAWFFVVMVSARLRQTPAQTMLDIEEAVEFIADNLPNEISMRVTHDEVRLLLRWQITYFRKRGVASYGSIDAEAEAAALRNKTVIAHEDDLVDELIRRSKKSGLELDAVDIVCVVDLGIQFLRNIGAIGNQISEVNDV